MKQKQQPPFPPVPRLCCREDWTKEMREQYADEKERLAYLHSVQIEDKATLKALYLLIKHSFQGKDLDNKQIETLERRQEQIKQQQRALAYRKLEIFELLLRLAPDAWADRWFPACETCKKRKEDIEWRIDPYQHELHGDESKHYICGDCYDNALGDI